MAFNTNPGRQEFTASASQTEFIFNFKIFTAVDINVYSTPSGQQADDVSDLLILDVDYTVVIDGDNGGTITLLVGATNNDAVTIVRRLPITRNYDYQTSGDLYADVLDLDQEYQTYLIADRKTVVSRSLVLPEADQTLSTILPSTIKGSYLKVNDDGTAFEYDTQVDFKPDATKETIADLRALDKPYETVWASGYHTKNDGAFGSNFYRLKGIATTEVDNGGTIILVTIGLMIYVYELQFDGTVSVRWFGAECDGITDDSVALVSALQYSIDNNLTVTSGGKICGAKGRHEFTSTTCTNFNIDNLRLKSIGENNEELQLKIDIPNSNVDVNKFFYDGDIENKYTVNNTIWMGIPVSSTGGNFGISVWPISSYENFALNIICKKVDANYIMIENSHSTGFKFICEVLNIDTFYAKNITFTSMYSYSKITNISKYIATNVGRALPTSFDVYIPSTSSWVYNVSQDDGYYAQGSFGLRLGGRGHINLDMVVVKNFYTTAVVLDTGSTSNISNIYIEHDEDTITSNQPSAGIFYELSTGATANNIQVVLKQRRMDLEVTNSIYLYTQEATNNFDNIILEDYLTDVSTTLFRIIDNENSKILINNISVKNTKNDAYRSSLVGVLNYPTRQPGNITLSSFSVEGRVDMDFRDFRKVLIDGITKTEDSFVKVYVGDYQANFPNTTKISDSDFNDLYGVSAGSGTNLSNCKIDGKINIYGESNTNTHSAIDNCDITLTGASTFHGNGDNTTLRFNSNVFTTDIYTLNIRTAGCVHFSDNIIRYNGSVNGITGTNNKIVKNTGTTALRGPGASAAVGYALTGSVNTINANNDTIIFDWTV